MTSEQQRKVVTIARSFIGKPYRYGATPEEAPDFFDCSSFTQYCLKQIGIEIPRSSILQAADGNGTEIVPAADGSNLEPGDLVFFRGQRGYYRDSLFPGHGPLYVGHVGIYAGAGSVIHAHAMREDAGVHEEPLRDLAQDIRYAPIFARRF